MKRKIIVGLALFTIVFVGSGVYVASTIRAATSDLDRLIALHQVQILREHYLVHLQRLQSDLLSDGRPERSTGDAIANAQEMRSVAETCFGCHHSPRVTERLLALRRDTDAYLSATERVLASPGPSPQPGGEDAEAFQIGERAMQRVRDIIDETATGLERDTRDALHDISRTKNIFNLLLAAVPLLALSLGAVLVSGLSRPLHLLLESTRKLQRGDLDYRVSGLKHEFGELEVAFNEMAASLKQQMSRMQRTEQMVVAGQLAAGLAHEIRNPLGGIKVAMQVLSAESRLSEADRRVLRSVAKEVVHVESLMTQFLHFARPAKPKLEQVDVNQVVELTLGFYKMSQQTPRDLPTPIRLAKELQPVPETLADPAQLQQVLLNLVLNAAEAMPGGGVLEVRTHLGERGDAVEIEVSDTGRGIAAEHLAKLFQPFFTTKPKGTGLGLATSKQLIDQHGGSIAVSPNPGGGTTFRIQLPLPTSTATAA